MAQHKSDIRPLREIAGIVPDCRYNHGPLAQQSLDNAPNGVWTLPGAKRVLTIMADGTTVNQLVQDQSVYSIQLFVCQTCGYAELFDDGAAHEQ